MTERGGMKGESSHLLETFNQRKIVEFEKGTHATYKMEISLRHMSAASVAVMLWTHEEIQTHVKEALGSREGYRTFIYVEPEKSHPTKDKWNMIEDKVVENSSILKMPKRCRAFLHHLLKRIGIDLFKWLQFQDDYVFDIRHNGKDKDANFMFSIVDGLPDAVSEAVKHLDKLTWTVMGQVDYKKTAQAIISDGELSDDSKFEMACNYCLEDDIRKLWDRVDSRNLSRSDALVRFWISKLTDDRSETESEAESDDEEQMNNRSKYERVFYWALGRNNETAAKYMWDSYHEEFRDWSPFSSAVKEAGCVFNANFMCYLLSQADLDQQEDAFERSFDQILKCLLDNWLWGSYLWGDYYLPTLHRVKDMMSETDVFCCLKDVAESISTSKESHRCDYKEVFKTLWRYSTKEYMFVCKDGVPRICEILYSLFSRKNVDLVHLVLADCGTEKKKEMLLSEKGIDACKALLINKEWDLLDIFIEHALESQKDLNRLKKNLKAKSGGNILSHLKKDEWKRAEKFFEWSFKSAEEMNNFKLELVHEDKDEMVTKLVRKAFDGDVADFTHLDNLLKWCLLSEDKANMFKSTMFQHDALKANMWKSVYELIEKDDFELLDLFLSWCFLNNQDAIYCFKMDLLSKELENYCIDLVLALVERGDKLQSLNTFIEWCSVNEETVSKFKENILHTSEDKLDVCARILLQDKFNLAEEFIAWCCGTQVEIHKFKTLYILEIFRSKYRSDKVIKGTLNKGVHKLITLIKWFDPSTEMIRNLRGSLNTKEFPKRLFQLLDDLIKTST